jgi:formate dehydrogenase major subunit
VPSLGATYGRGAATLPQWDLANSDSVLVMGSNMAENHPIAFRFVMQAKEKGAVVMHADPRFTRTSAMADIYAPVRAGTDIAFLGGIINYLLENDLWFRDYALAYTNLATVIGDDFKDASADEGRFAGWNEETSKYSFEPWQYRGLVVPTSLAEHYFKIEGDFDAETDRLKVRPPEQDETLQHPNCVYQILRRHYAAYTPEMVERVTGCPRETFLGIARAMAENSGRERTGAICYAVGWTHHSTGVQIIRAAAIIQALLGNVGRPGGGVLALRGHTSIQGSTDIPTLYNMLPTYLAQPNAHKPHKSLENYLAVETIPTGWWANLPSYMVSLLKAWYGDAATKDSEYGYGFLPKIVGDHSQLPLTLAMHDGTIRGLILYGQNPVVGGSNAELVEAGLASLEWLVVRDTHLTDTATFWESGRRVRGGKVRPQEIGTEIFLMPTALAGEKAGSFTNTHRLVQWHDHVVDAPGDSRSDLWFTYHLGRRLKALYAASDAPRDAAIKAVTLDYPTRGPRRDPDAEAILREINGYTVADGEQLGSFEKLKDDGSTACGGWLYTGVFPNRDLNKARQRKPDGADGPGTHLGWAFAWPANRRNIYNRASADPDGKPWSERKRLAWWDEDKGRWECLDSLDYDEEKRPDYRPDFSRGPLSGTDAHSGAEPFIMMPDGRAHIFSPSGLKDGPLPTHYEPIESPVKNPLYGQQHNPAAKIWDRGDNPLHGPGDPRYPHALTSYRLTEHHSGGTPTRGVPHTAELQPEGFAEIPPELAAEHGIRNLDWVVISTPRGEVETRALVTERLRPFEIDGRRVYQIGMPWHFGWEGYATGDVMNALTAVVGDPNTSMHENKALTCGLRRGRLRR